MELLELDWSTVFYHLTLLGVAYILAVPIGWNRERHARSAGLRTFPLVAVATCAFMLVGLDTLSSPDSQARVLEGIITGMGFIGGGAILKSGKVVTGTATAAALWGTGAVGVAVAWQRYESAGYRYRGKRGRLNTLRVRPSGSTAHPGKFHNHFGAFGHSRYVGEQTDRA